jgi:GNAT superfamily N-acetyltransferase
MATHFKNLTRKLYRNLNDYGLRMCLHKSFAHPLRIFFEKVHAVIYKIDIAENVTEINNEDNFTFKLIGGRDHFFINKIEKMAEWLEGKLGPSLLTDKRICMAIFDKEKIIGFYLAGFEKVVLPKLSIEMILKDDEVWGEEIMIDREYRGKGLATVLKKRIYKEFQTRGINSLYGHVGLYNKASLKSAGKFHLSKIFYTRFLKIFNYERLIFYEMPMDLYGQNRTDPVDWLFLDPYHLIKKSIVNKHRPIINFKKKKDQGKLFKIKTSDLF